MERSEEGTREPEVGFEPPAAAKRTIFVQKNAHDLRAAASWVRQRASRAASARGFPPPPPNGIRALNHRQWWLLRHGGEKGGGTSRARVDRRRRYVRIERIDDGGELG